MDSSTSIETPRKDVSFGVIKVNRNVISFVGIEKMSSVELNVLVSIIDALRNHIVMGEAYPVGNNMDLIVNIPWRLVSMHHDPRKTLASIIPLMDTKVFYSYSFGGIETTGIVHVIDQAEYSSGEYQIRISAKALPWYVFCGKNVGFANIEKTVYYSLSSPRLKVLYLMIMCNVDAKTKCGRRSFTVDDLRALLGLESTPYYKMKQSVIKPLLEVFEKALSMYHLSVTEETCKAGGIGRPSVETTTFNIEPKATNEADDCARAHQLISMCCSIWDSRRQQHKTPIDIVNELNGNGNVGAFLYKMTKAVERARKNASDRRNNRWHIANTAVKILREDFKLDVFSSGKSFIPNWEGKTDEFFTSLVM